MININDIHVTDETLRAFKHLKPASCKPNIICINSWRACAQAQAWAYKQKHKKNESTYLSCAVFTSNALEISISIRTRKTNGSVFLVLILKLMSSVFLVKTARNTEISEFVLLMFLLICLYLCRDSFHLCLCSSENQLYFIESKEFNRQLLWNQMEAAVRST